MLYGGGWDDSMSVCNIYFYYFILYFLYLFPVTNNYKKEKNIADLWQNFLLIVRAKTEEATSR